LNFAIINASNYFGATTNTKNYYNSNNNTNKLKYKQEIIQDSDRFSYVRDEDYGWGDGNYYQAKQKAKSAASSMPIGSRVYHETFGYGKVLNIDGNKLEIWFDQYGHKRLLKDYLKKA